MVKKCKKSSYFQKITFSFITFESDVISECTISWNKRLNSRVIYCFHKHISLNPHKIGLKWTFMSCKFSSSVSMMRSRNVNLNLICYMESIQLILMVSMVQSKVDKISVCTWYKATKLVDPTMKGIFYEWIIPINFYVFAFEFNPWCC